MNMARAVLEHKGIVEGRWCLKIHHFNRDKAITHYQKSEELIDVVGPGTGLFTRTDLIYASEGRLPDENKEIVATTGDSTEPYESAGGLSASTTTQQLDSTCKSRLGKASTSTQQIDSTYEGRLDTASTSTQQLDSSYGSRLDTNKEITQRIKMVLSFDSVQLLFRLPDPEGPIQQTWSNAVKVILRCAGETLGKTRGGFRGDNKAWLWIDEIQRVVRQKKLAYKRWEKTRAPEDLAAYRTSKRVGKVAVAKAKLMEMDALYERLQGRERENVEEQYYRPRLQAEGRRDGVFQLPGGQADRSYDETVRAAARLKIERIGPVLTAVRLHA
ncbi:unnamed protein product [Haemonchus placei]|uniref:Cauli_VI domain-containing protein n=1 Tax=Haemonchus placei TaxID=6290 RepID=A0A0N4X653_HAEPC|nr:unnamed protein product [Haemonchus placei]